jgi:hypothetical protein
MEKDNIIILAVVSFIFIVFAMFGLLIVYIPKNQVALESNMENNLPCSNLDFQDSMNCLVKEQDKWWKYNISNIGLYRNNGVWGDINWSVIKEQGGVCSHSSKNYIEEAEKLGFMGKEIKFWGDDKVGHEVALLYSKDLNFYCILDQQATPKCQELNPREKVKDEN